MMRRYASNKLLKKKVREQANKPYHFFVAFGMIGGP